MEELKSPFIEKNMKKMNQISLNLVVVVCKDGEQEWKIAI